MLRLKSADKPEERTETLRRIRDAAAAHEPKTYVAGEPVQLHDMFRYVEQDAFRLGWATSGLLLIVIAVMFRSLRWMALPLLVVYATIYWTRALLVLSQMKLSMVSSMLNSLVTIIGIATVMHVTVTFRELRQDHDRIAAFRETFVTLIPPVFWTTVTTAIGFMSLFTSDIVPVRSFGTMVTLGTMLILATCAAILPGGILLGGLDADPRDTPFERHVIRALLAITHRVEQRPKLLFSLCLGLMAAAALGLDRLKVETDFSRNFRSSSDVAQAVTFFESHLGGAGNWEVNFEAPAVLDDEYLDKVRQLARRLREIEMSDGTKLSKVYALTDGLDFIPTMLAKTIDERRAALRQIQPYYEKQLYNPEARRMRLYLRAREQKPAEIKLALIAKVEQTAREAFPQARTTGLYVLIANLITSLLGDQLTSALVSATGIVICMTIAFRNFWIGLASLLPNVFPILVLIGGMGWLDVPVNIGTAMIASVSMGLTIDTSIHYIAGYRRARERGMDHAAAIRETHASVGRALVFANVALVAGFSALSVSNFIPLIYFGVLVSLAMVGGLVGNLVLLPLLLRWVPLKIAAARV
jgi:predicted RND superfamily exporter protein